MFTNNIYVVLQELGPRIQKFVGSVDSFVRSSPVAFAPPGSLSFSDEQEVAANKKLRADSKQLDLISQSLLDQLRVYQENLEKARQIHRLVDQVIPPVL